MRDPEIDKIMSEGFAILGRVDEDQKREQLIPIRCSQCAAGKVMVPRGQLEADRQAGKDQYVCNNHGDPISN
jgi:hypothetical protein